MALPLYLHVTNEHEEEEGGWFAASVTPEDAVKGSEDQFPTVGTYKLVAEQTLELVTTVKVREVSEFKKKKNKNV